MTRERVESVGFEIVGDLIGQEDGRPVRFVREVVFLNAKPVEVMVPRPLAGVGSDGSYHVGLLVNPEVVRRAMWLTDRLELQRMGVPHL